MNNRPARTFEAPDRGYLLTGSSKMLPLQRLLDLEHGVYTLCWNVAMPLLGSELVEMRGVLPVIDHEIELLALSSFAVHNEGSIYTIPARKVVSKELEPHIFDGVSLSYRVSERTTGADERRFEILL